MIRPIQPHLISIVGGLSLLFMLHLPGCSSSETNAQPDVSRVVVYCSVDESFGREILDRFSQETGIDIAVIFDTEAGKTTGLVNKIIAESESGRPRADVFFSSEVFNTIRLARMGLLKAYQPSTASDIPTRYRDREHRWTGLAVRARVIAYDASPEANVTPPPRWEDVALPVFAPHVAFANPLFGTTRGHVAAMFALWGPKRGRAFLQNLRRHGALMAEGNSSAVRAIISKRVRMAMTDSDDVWVAQKKGAALRFVYPDMGDGGTMLIPCTVALVAGRPNNGAAESLADFLVSATVERMLAQSRSRNIPVRPALRAALGMTFPPETKVSFDAVVDAMDEAMLAVREILLK